MPLDTRIALGIEPIKLADPMAQYNQFAQARAAGNQNALAEYNLGSAQRADVTANALNKGYKLYTDPNTGEIDYPRMRNYLAQQDAGSQIPAMEKQRFELGNLETESKTKQTKLLTDRLALLPDAYRMADTPQAYAQLQEQIHADPVVGKWLNSIGATKEKGMASLQKAVDEGTFDKLRMGSMQNVTQILDSMKPVVVGASSSVYDPNTRTYNQAPSAPEKAKQTDLMVNYQAAKDQGFVGSIFDYERKLKEAGRAPTGGEGEKMPTGSINVLDPSDPTGKKVIVVTAARAIKEGLVPFTSVPKEGGATEAERKAATLLQRLQFSQSQLTQALTDNPNAAKPNVFASAVSKLSTPLANTLTPETRQRVEAAQLDMLDAALTLGTGAAYTNEQLEGYRKSYFPQIGDGPQQVKDKQARLENIISAAKIAAGRAEKLVPQVPGASSFDAADAILAKINKGRR
jgi:hypothetical protein